MLQKCQAAGAVSLKDTNVGAKSSRPEQLVGGDFVNLQQRIDR
jgi:hypothetical protein